MNALLKPAFSALVLVLVACGHADGPAPSSETYAAAERRPVFYEANPKVFAASQSLKAIQSRLDDIRALGTDVLWLMPIQELGVKDAVGSPYCIRDYKALNASYGNIADLKALVEAAHGKGMKVIMDWVANHTAWDHAWITDHPDWYTQEGGVIISPKGMGWPDVADLDYSNASMRAAMKDAMLYWIRETDVDGYRCDYADGVPLDFWTDAISSIHSLKKEAVMLAESSDSRFLSAGFDYIYGWPYKTALKALFDGGAVSDFQEAVIRETKSLPSGGHILRFTTNHDQASVASPVSEFKGAEGALAAFVVTAFIGESPLIYSSQETGYAKPLSFFTPQVMDWAAGSSSIQAYRQIMSAYDAVADIRKGAPKFYSTQDILSMYYENADKALLVLVNVRGTATEAKTPMERAGEKMKDIMTGASVTLSSTLSLEGYEYKIYVR